MPSVFTNGLLTHPAAMSVETSAAAVVVGRRDEVVFAAVNWHRSSFVRV